MCKIGKSLFRAILRSISPSLFISHACVQSGHLMRHQQQIKITYYYDHNGMCLTSIAPGPPQYIKGGSALLAPPPKFFLSISRPLAGALHNPLLTPRRKSYRRNRSQSSRRRSPCSTKTATEKSPPRSWAPS